jgi:hypothetical protein
MLVLVSFFGVSIELTILPHYQDHCWKFNYELMNKRACLPAQKAHFWPTAWWGPVPLQRHMGQRSFWWCKPWCCPRSNPGWPWCAVDEEEKQNINVLDNLKAVCLNLGEDHSSSHGYISACSQTPIHGLIRMDQLLSTCNIILKAGTLNGETTSSHCDLTTKKLLQTKMSPWDIIARSSGGCRWEDSS